MERDESSSSKTGTITRPRHSVDKPVRIKFKTKADVYNEAKQRESEKSYSPVTDDNEAIQRESEKSYSPVTNAKDQNLLIIQALEDKLSKNQQDVAHVMDKLIVLSKDQDLLIIQTIVGKSSKNQQDVAHAPDKLNLLSKDQHLPITQFSEGKSSKYQQDAQNLLSKGAKSQTFSLIYRKFLQNGGKAATAGRITCMKHAWLFSEIALDTNQRAMTTERLNRINNQLMGSLHDIKLSQGEYIKLKSSSEYKDINIILKNASLLLQHDMKLFPEEFSKLKFSSENMDIKYYIFLCEEFKAMVFSNRILADYEELYSFLLHSLGGTDALGKRFQAHIDEFLKNLILKVANYDEANYDKAKQRLGEKEMKLKKLIKEEKLLRDQISKLEIYFQEENQLTEPEKTGLKEQYILKERDLQKEDKLKEQVKTELSADNIVYPRTKIRNAKSEMNTSSLNRAYNLYRKNVIERALVSLEQLTEALDNVKSPYYIWPSGHPLILSKIRPIEQSFSSNEYMERLHSFVFGRNRWHRTWDNNQFVRPEPIVSAGFSYDGEDDKVVCKSCGAISDVNDWSDDDEDYAFTMHRRTGSSHCEFLSKFDQRRSNI